MPTESKPDLAATLRAALAIQRQRLKRGLSLYEAARLLACNPGDLYDVEAGRMPLTPEMAERMKRVYEEGM